MDSVENIVQAFVGVWNERDPARRREMVQTLWVSDGRHLMGAQDVRGHSALEERVATSNQRNVIEKGYIFLAGHGDPVAAGRYKIPEGPGALGIRRGDFRWSRLSRNQ